MSIKVLHINYSDIKGGAIIAVKGFMMHKKNRCNPRIVVAEKYLDHKDVIGQNLLLKIKWKILNSINRKIGNLEKKDMTQLL